MCPRRSSVVTTPTKGPETMHAERAHNAFDELRAVRNELGRLYCRTGDLERDAGRFESAMHCYRKAAVLATELGGRTNPDRAVDARRLGNPDLCTGLGERALASNDDESAAMYFARALAIREQSPLAYRGLATLHMRAGRSGAARAAMRRAEALEAPRATKSIDANAATVRQIHGTAIMLSRFRALESTDPATDELPTARLDGEAKRYRTTRLERPAVARSSAA